MPTDGSSLSRTSGCYSGASPHCHGELWTRDGKSQQLSRIQRDWIPIRDHKLTTKPQIINHRPGLGEPSPGSGGNQIGRRHRRG
ncbi:hypothetical protein RHGRI_001478 [Rhododendron griersonianum]|uniref:Uncharacterized protein n=1 Tax=Rhododendron griersonianum TaxID=479676 RepID=A0AAV6LL68_9ERIC|nr:hypothetical protein RHGRI_001478 [Rhododendron griersonianum]